MEGDYLELSQFPYNPHPFPYNSHQSPLGTIGFLTNGIRAVDPVTSNCDERKILKKIQELLNKALEESKEISKKMKALAESNMAMKEELSRVKEDLENMSEEEFQLLEGTSEKFQVVESTKTVLDSEDANDSEDVADLEEFLDLKELVSFNSPCKGPIAVQVQVHSTPQTPVETIIACPIQDQIYLMHGYLGHVYSGQVSIICGISLASCKGVEVDLGYDCFDGQIYFMCGYIGHVYSGHVSIICGYHQASLRFCLGDKPNLLFQEGSLVTFMEADTYNFPSKTSYQ